MCDLSSCSLNKGFLKIVERAWFLFYFILFCCLCTNAAVKKGWHNVCSIEKGNKTVPLFLLRGRWGFSNVQLFCLGWESAAADTASPLSVQSRRAIWPSVHTMPASSTDWLPDNRAEQNRHRKQLTYTWVQLLLFGTFQHPVSFPQFLTLQGRKH